MPSSHYLEFVLILEDVTPDAEGCPSSFSVSVFDSPVGQGERKEIVTLPAPLRNRLQRVASRVAGAELDLTYQMNTGEIIGSMLLPPYARQMFVSSLARLGNGERLRLRLRLADALAEVPWELAYVRDARGERTSSGFLALDPRISIVRHEALATPGDWFGAPANRRIVMAMAAPDGAADLDSLSGEQAKLEQLLSRVPGACIVVARGARNGGATLKGLLNALSEKTDIFHFSGHGNFKEDALGPTLNGSIGAGAIMLVGENNEPVHVPAEDLARLLKGVRVVVLNSCNGARRDGYRVWSGVAAALLKAGIAAVVAMQIPIYDDMSAAFSIALYTSLVTGATLDEAVTAGRLAIKTAVIDDEQRRDCIDWSAPVLYMRVPGGTVFNPVSDDAQRAKAQKETDHLITQRIDEIGSAGRLIGAVVDDLKVESIIIEQRVKEDIKGILIGGAIFGVSGGRITVEQDLQCVSSGTVIGYYGSADKNLEKLLNIRRS